MHAQPGMHEVTGIILPHAWDRPGVPAAVSIHGRDESVTVVADTPKGKELLAHCRAMARVKGSVQDRGGRRELAVCDYEILRPWKAGGKARAIR